MIFYGKKEDIEAIKSLFNECFPEDLAFNEWFFENVFDYKNAILYKRDNQIVAMLQAMPYRLYAMGEVSYIYGACTKKEYRKQGIMKRLIEFSFDEDIKNGRIASVLIPANKELFDFYGKMGYEKGFFIDEKIENRFTLSSTLSLAEIGQNADEIAEMVDIYVNRLKDSYFIARDRDYFACQIRLFNELGSRVYLLKDRARTVGYCFLFDEAVPFAQELMTINDEKYLADFKALLFKQTQKDKIKFVTNDGDIPFGCIKWHKAMEKARKKGYMNLMFN